MLPDKTYHAVCAQVTRLLCEERKRRGFSRYAVAKRCGLSEQMVGYVERGMRNPSLETVLRLTAALNIDLGEIVNRAYLAAGVRGQK
jgi:transcriptional regulator with XRE-family HTH domain